MNEPINCTASELSTFLQALGEGYFPTYYSDTNPCAPSRSMTIASKSYQRGRKTVSFRGSQFLMTFGALTEPLGAALLTWYREGFRARTLAAPEREQASKGSGPACGKKWRGSLAKYDPSARTWRTHQVSLFEGLTECSVIFPTWGLMRDGELWEQLIPDFPMRDNALGSWPTPKARDYKSGGTDPAKVQARIDRRKNQGVIDLPDAAVHRLWRPGFSGLLNPSFSEAIMDWPIGWTACEPLETGKFQEWQQQHSIY